MPARPLNAIHVVLIAWLFSFVGVFTAMSFDGHTTPLTVIAVRSIAVALLLGVYLSAVRTKLRLAPAELGKAVLLGLVLAVNNYSLTAAIERIPVPLAVMLFYVWPGLTAIASTLLGQDRASGRTFVGLALSFIGIALALRVKFTDAEWTGVLLALLSSLSWTAMMLLASRFLHARDSRPYTFWMTVTTGVLFIALCAITGDFSLPAAGRAWFALVALPFVYVFALIGFYAANGALGPVKTGFFMNFEPIASVLMAGVLLGQALAPIQLAGAALVVGALFLYRPLKA